MGRLRSSKHDIVTLLRSMRAHYPQMRTAAVRNVVWSKILKECQQEGAFLGREVQFLYKQKWPALIRAVARKKMENKHELTVQEHEIIAIERMKNPLFCLVSESDRKAIVDTVSCLLTAVCKEGQPTSDHDSDAASISDRLSPEPIATLHLDYGDDVREDDDEMAAMKGTKPSMSYPNETEPPMPMFPSFVECVPIYFQAMDEYIKVCRLRQQEIELLIERTKLEIDVLKKSAN